MPFRLTPAAANACRLDTLMSRLLLIAVVALPFTALAEGECQDDYLECKDGCLIDYGGSIRVEVKKQFDKCMKKCTKIARRCTERSMETKASGLDEGALDGAPTSDQVDEHGMPTSTASKKKKKSKVAAEEPASEEVSDEPARPRESLSDGEVPKSSRTAIKTDDDAPSKKKKGDEPSKGEVAKQEEPPKKEVIEMKLSPTKSTNDEDLRDDKPRASSPPKEEPRDEEPPPPPKKEKKKEEPPKKKEEDHDDLRYY